MAIINLDDPRMWFQTCEQQNLDVFQFVMSMIMKVLTIT
jgi:hypothetical protein